VYTHACGAVVYTHAYGAVVYTHACGVAWRRSSSRGPTDEPTQRSTNHASRRQPQETVRRKRCQIKPRYTHIEETPTLQSQTKHDNKEIRQDHRDLFTCNWSSGTRPPIVCNHTPSHRYAQAHPNPCIRIHAAGVS